MQNWFGIGFVFDLYVIEFRSNEIKKNEIANFYLWNFWWQAFECRSVLMNYLLVILLAAHYYCWWPKNLDASRHSHPLPYRTTTDFLFLHGCNVFNCIYCVCVYQLNTFLFPTTFFRFISKLFAIYSIQAFLHSVSFYYTRIIQCAETIENKFAFCAIRFYFFGCFSFPLCAFCSPIGWSFLLKDFPFRLYGMF